MIPEEGSVLGILVMLVATAAWIAAIIGVLVGIAILNEKGRLPMWLGIPLFVVFAILFSFGLGGPARRVSALAMRITYTAQTPHGALTYEMSPSHVQVLTSGLDPGPQPVSSTLWQQVKDLYDVGALTYTTTGGNPNSGYSTSVILTKFGRDLAFRVMNP